MQQHSGCWVGWLMNDELSLVHKTTKYLALFYLTQVHTTDPNNYAGMRTHADIQKSNPNMCSTKWEDKTEILSF